MNTRHARSLCDTVRDDGSAACVLRYPGVEIVRARMSNVVVYSSRYCPYCRRAKSLLTSKGVSFEEIDVDDDPERRAEMIERAGGRWTVPQIFIDGRHIGGCDDLLALDYEGSLDGLLGL